MGHNERPRSARIVHYGTVSSGSGWAAVAVADNTVFGNGSTSCFQSGPYETNRVITYTARKGEEAETHT